jgi:hypothetical protein
MPSLVYNSTKRNVGKWVERLPDGALIGFATHGLSIVTFKNVTDAQSFCNPSQLGGEHLTAHDSLSFMLRAARESLQQKDSGGTKSGRFNNPSADFSHGALLVGLKKLVNKRAAKVFNKNEETPDEV